MDVQERDGLTIVRVTERRLDAAAAPAFKAGLLGLVEEGHRSFVLDLSMLEFLDSTGLGTMVSLLKALGPEGGLALAGAQAPVRKLLTLTRLDRVFRLYETPDDAERALRS